MKKAIEIENFSYGYPDGTMALSEIKLSIDHGQKVVLIGPNGAGKTTLLRVLATLIKPTSGRAVVDGFDVLDMLAADRIPFTSYHMPFPAVGYIDKRADGSYHYVPVSYQLDA